MLQFLRDLREFRRCRANMKELIATESAQREAVLNLVDHRGYWIVKAMILERLMEEMATGDRLKLAGGLSVAASIFSTGEVERAKLVERKAARSEEHEES